MNTNEKITVAKSLRKSFCRTQSDLLKSSYWSDEKLAEIVREMQSEYEQFSLLVDQIKAEDSALYDLHILGIKD